MDEIGLKYAFDFAKGKNYKGGDKTSLGFNFTSYYDNLFNKRKNEKLNLLELGIFYGKSLAMWSDYFVNGSIYGIDISLKYFYEHESILKKRGAFKNDNIRLFQYDLTNIELEHFIQNLPNFDIIIDDANHQPNIQYNNFMLLYNKLNPNGYYIIEDIIDPVKFFDLFRDLYLCISNKSNSLIKQNKYYKISIKFDSIEIRNKMVIFHKASEI